MAYRSEAELEMSQFPQASTLHSPSPQSPFVRPELEMTSSTNSLQTRYGRHGMMAKCKSFMPSNTDSNILTCCQDLHKQVDTHQWLDPAVDDSGNPITSLNLYRGVVLRSDDGSPVPYPATLSAAVMRAVVRIDVPVALTMSSEITAQLLRQLNPKQTELVDRDTGIKLPIIDSVHNLASGTATVAKDSFICLCRKERMVLIWGDTVSATTN